MDDRPGPVSGQCHPVRRSSRDIPSVFIARRDRLTGLRDLVAWLETTNQDRIYLLDNQPTYPLRSSLTPRWPELQAEVQTAALRHRWR